MKTGSPASAANHNDHDMDWLKRSLQTAIELEHSTLPLYLSAMFSLKVQNYTNYNMIRSVVMEEMVHMAIVCNILAAIGGSPKIKKLQPVTPGKGLPGGAEPDLEVILAQLSKRQLTNFMRLEVPAFLLPPEYKKEEYPTISSFYKTIVDAIDANADAVRAAVKKQDGKSNQVGDNIGFTTIEYSPDLDPVEQIKSGIHEIIEQGEGSNSRSLHSPEFENETSHYAKFAELFYGSEYQLPQPPLELCRENEAEFFKGNSIGWPQITNILAVPGDGYKKLLEDDPNSSAVEKVLSNFDKQYSNIMNLLDLMWNGPAAESWPNFGKAVGAMTELRVLSTFYIMPNEIPTPLIAKLETLYPEEYKYLASYSVLDEKIYYGPRFINQN